MWPTLGSRTAKGQDRTPERVDLNLPSVKIDHTKLEHLNADQKDALLKLLDEFAN